MNLVRIALANIDATVGAMRSNADRVIAHARRAAADAATVVVFPEQVVGGYPPEDLVQWSRFVAAEWAELERIAKETAALPSLLAIGLAVARGPGVYNCAALVHRGKILGVVPKEKLPTYNVFYEGRTLAHGAAGLTDEVHGVPFGDLVFDADFGTLALEVCEDIWSPDGPMRRRAYAGALLTLNLSASPFRVGVNETRREMISTRAADNQIAIAYANLVGANDGLIFDGGGFVAQNGRLVHSAPRFVEGISAVTLDLDRTRRLRLENTTWRDDQQAWEQSAAKPARVRLAGATERAGLRYPAPAHRSFFLPAPEVPRSARSEFCEELLDALALGVGGYFTKTGAFKLIGVALSGGRDSLLTLIIARRWVERAGKSPAQTLRGFFMPSRFSSAETRRAAELAASELGVPLVVLPVDDAFDRELEAAQKMLQPGETLTPAVRQNAQARVRAARMWNWSNATGGLFLQTSNMSE